MIASTSPGTGRNDGREYAVVVGTAMNSRLTSREEFRPESLRRGFSTLYVLNCLGCEIAEATMTVQTEPTLIQRFNHLNFDCVGPWHSCKHPEDMAPDLAAEALRDHQRQKEPAEGACSLSATVLARAANDILLVKVLSTQTHNIPGTEDKELIVEAQVLQTIKNAKVAGIGDHLNFIATPDSFSSKKTAARSTDTAGKNYFFLYRQPGEDATFGRELKPCHGIPDTPENERSIRAGVALDRSTGEIWDWGNELSARDLP